MVDAPDVVVTVDEHMAALAVGVVGDEVEHGDARQCGLQVVAGFLNGEVVLLVIGIDVPLHAALTVGAVTDDGGWHQVDLHRLTEHIGRQLTPVQAGFEVPQGALAAHWLVDGLTHRSTVDDQFHQERRVAAPRHAALDDDVGRA